MNKSIFFIISALNISITYSQGYYNIVIPSDQNWIDGIYAPAIENQDKSVSVLSQTKYRNNYGGKESLVRLSQHGLIIGNYTFLDPIENTYSFDLIKNENSIYVCGTKFKYYDTIEIFWYGKLNSEYDTLWTREIKTNYDRCFFQRIRPLLNNQIVLCGSDDKKKPNSPASLTAHGVVVITDSLGNVVHYIEVNDQDTTTLEGFYGLTEDIYGNIYACGIVKKSNLNHDALVVKISSDGKLIWRKQIPSADYLEGVLNIFNQHDGTLLCIGDSYNSDFFGDQFAYTLLINMNSDGNINWTKRIMKIYNGEIKYCVQDTSGNYICAGTIISEPNKPADGYLIKFSAQGDSIWTRQIDNSNFSNEQFFNIASASDCGFYLTGFSWIEGITSSKSWIVKVDSFGCLVPGCQNTVKTKDIDEGRIKAFEIYPNPAKEVLYFLSRITKNDDYTINICDLQGKEVYNYRFMPVLGKQYIMEFANNVLPGIYLLNIHDGKGRIVQTESIEKM